MPNPTTPQSIQVNGQTEALTCATLSALLETKEIAGAPRGVAIALNGVVVPRAEWARTALAAGDQVEIVRVKQGG